MAEVNYMASTSTADHLEEPSVEIVNPKSNRSSFSSTKDEKPSDSKKSDHPNKPSDELWRQQKLPAWQPILTADTVLPAFFLLGVAFIPIGVGLLVSSNLVQEVVYDYTDCKRFDDQSRKCSDIIDSDLSKLTKCECRENFTLTENFKAPIFLYYGLSKFYQNHRRYVQSRDNNQLVGKVGDLDKLCEPYREFKGANDSKAKPIAPCGAIANSLFNDTFKLYFKNSDGSEEEINLIQTQIAWPTDKDIKFKNPDGGFSKYAKPLYWQKYVDDLDPDPRHDNNGYKNEHLIVWMRTAAFPSFRKLWARVDHDQNMFWRTELPKGNYQIRINYNYPVTFGKYNGEKKFIISNTSWLGGKNGFLGYAYIVVGSLCFLLWIVFLVIVKKFSHKPKDVVDFGPKTPYQTTTYRSTDTS